MGSQQSQNMADANDDENIPPSKVVTIDRADIPDAYKRVFVSDGVVRSVLEHNNTTTTIQKSPPPPISAQNVVIEESPLQQQQQYQLIEKKTNYQDELNKIFNETVEKVEKQLANTHESACKENEDEILKCLSKNGNQILKCDSLWKSYETCVSKYGHSILKESKKSH